MVGREAETFGMVPEACESEMLRSGDKQPQHSFSRWARADPRFFLGINPHGDELGQRRLVVVEHSECTVTGTGHRCGLFDNMAQKGRELEIPLDKYDGLEDPAELGGILNGMVWHRPILEGP